jgi:hypothetical protein
VSALQQVCAGIAVSLSVELRAKWLHGGDTNVQADLLLEPRSRDDLLGRRIGLWIE